MRKIIVDDNNKNYSSIDGVVLSKDKTKVLIYPAGKKDAHYVIPNTVTTIEGGGVFNCENLTSITIPRGVTNIEEGAFSGFDYLSKIIVDDNNQDYCSVDDVVFNKNKTVLVSYPGGKADSIYTIPTGVTRVGDGAVACNNFLKRVIISDGVTDIGEFAFNGCSHLTRMTIPASVENIGYGAFSACERLADVYYSGSQEEWDKINFDGSNDLENMTIHYNTSGPTEKDISDYNIFLDVGAYTYDGTPKKPAVTVKNGAITLTSGRDYEVTYADNTDVGTAKVIITGKGDYVGSAIQEFEIWKADQILSIHYGTNKVEVGKNITIEASAKTDVSYSSSDAKVAAVSASGVVTGKAVGTVTITITANASKNYNEISHTLQVTVTEPQTTKKISDCVVTLQSMSYTYDGTEKKPVVTVKDGSNTLTNGKDYEVAYENNINAGTAKVTVTGKGNYTGTVTMNVVIKKAASVITASHITKATSAKAQKVSIGAKVKGGAKLTYKSNNKYVTVDKKGQVTIAKKFVGQATITITAAATKNYNAGTKKVTVTVNPASTKLSSVKNSASKSMKVAWKKNAAVTGCQVQYATAKNFKGAKTVTVKKAKTTSTTIKKLTKGKKYYVRVRTYQKVGGKTYYSAWSASKNVTIKK